MDSLVSNPDAKNRVDITIRVRGQEFFKHQGSRASERKRVRGQDAFKHQGSRASAVPDAFLVKKKSNARADGANPNA